MEWFHANEFSEDLFKFIMQIYWIAWMQTLSVKNEQEF